MTYTFLFSLLSPLLLACPLREGKAMVQWRIKEEVNKNNLPTSLPYQKILHLKNYKQIPIFFYPPETSNK